MSIRIRTWFAMVPCVVGCGGTVDYGASSGQGGSGSVAGQSGVSQGASANGASGSSALDAGLQEYVDPGCPEAGAPVESDRCDAFSSATGCPPGKGCYPFVRHPQSGAGCGAQVFGTECLAAGSGHQGAFCAGIADCASGFICAVGTEPGKHCVQLCHPGDHSSCPTGLICSELDVEGFRACS